MYSLELVPQVLKELGDTQRYPAKVFRQLALKIFALGQNPKPQDVQKIGADYRVDSGEYRIYYAIDDARLCRHHPDRRQTRRRRDLSPHQTLVGVIQAHGQQDHLRLPARLRRPGARAQRAQAAPGPANVGG